MIDIKGPTKVAMIENSNSLSKNLLPNKIPIPQQDNFGTPKIYATVGFITKLIFQVEP